MDTWFRAFAGQRQSFGQLRWYERIQATAHLISQRLFRGNIAFCSLHTLQCEWRSDWRLWYREPRHGPPPHSSYNALQLSATGQTPHRGPGLQASYTWSKSLDDTSTVAGTSATSSVGAIAQAAPQNPFDTHPERGPSTFDATHSFSLSLTQEVPLQSISFLSSLNRKFVEGMAVSKCFHY